VRALGYACAARGREPAAARHEPTLNNERMEYALLIAPSANRVYAATSARIVAAELLVFSGVLDQPIHDVAEIEIGGVDYVGFRTDEALTARDVAYLSNVSAAYALFERVGDLLRPVRLRPLAHFDEDLLTIPKYSGKTNEQFTKLLLNVTVLGSTRAKDMLGRRLVVCDPLCGRGTTLDQALIYGYDALGIDIDSKDFDLYAAFVKTYLKRKRLKHHAEITPVRKDKRNLARRLSVRIGDASLTVFHADTTQAREFLKGGVADVIVTDLPYGVAHGSRTAATGLSRGPLDLLKAALPVWSSLIAPGGAIGVSWNTHVTSRSAAAELFAQHGFKLLEGPGYDGFEHWVDQAITRDVIVARKL
jgi:hypothetical protein